MAVKKTQMYRRQLDGTETDLNPLTESQYVLMENGQTVQEVLSDRDSDKYTPVITNSSSTFKVGQGDNVDLSSSMKEGAYDSCVLKGKTMVNCIQEPSSKDVVLPYEFADGRYVTINDTKESGVLGVELKGQTLVNSILSIDKTLPYTWTSNNITSRTCALRGVFKTGVYALIVEFGEVLLGGVQSSQGVLSAIQVNYTDGTLNSYSRSGLENYSKKRFFTTFTINKEVASIEFKGTATQYEDVTTEGYVPPTVTINKIMILEYQEGMENWDIPYFEGMASCKMPILRTVGKNLFDGELITGKIEDNGKPNTNVSTMCMSANYTRVQPNTTYNYKWIQELNSSRIFFYDANKNFIKKEENAIPPTGGQFTTPSNCYYILFHLAVNAEMDSYTVLITKSNDLTYEPYKSSILSLPEEVVLRSLPNGVCDTFNTRTGVYTQRIGEVVFDGSSDESWWLHQHQIRENTIETAICFQISVSDMRNDWGSRDELWCDKFNSTRNQFGDTIESVYWGCATNVVARANNALVVCVDKIGTSATNETGFKQWLSQNPITVQYLLDTPIVTKINLPSTLKSWNTTTHIYSEIPENTLYPILSHSNPTYPVILKPSTKYSIVANSYSNSHTNSAINFNLGGATASTTVGNRVTTITTPSTLTSEELVMSGRGNKLNNVMVIEGDVAGDESYFEGICDCKSPILLNIGKNLFDWEAHHWRLNRFQWSHGNGGLGNGNALGRAGVEWVSIKTLKLKPNQTYYTNGHISFYENDGQGLCIDRRTHNGVFTVPANAEIACVSALINDGVKLEYMSDPKIIISEIEMEYEPYKSNTTTFEQKDDKTIVLRSLPSSVCDTLNVETGEYVQRIGEIVLDGSQNVASWWNTTSTIGVAISIPTMKNISNLVCDRLPVVYYGNINNDTYDTEGIASWDNGNVVRFRILKSKLTTEDVDGVKQYLAINPITVQYELATPIVSTIDIQGFPYAYTNGHVQLSSGHSGQSLTPKVEYSLSANKTGQINSNTKRVSTHQKQLDDFEAMMLTSLVQSAYDKAILQFDYEMQMMSLGGE